MSHQGLDLVEELLLQRRRECLKRRILPDVGWRDRQLLVLAVEVREVEEMIANDRSADREAGLRRVLGAEALGHGLAVGEYQGARRRPRAVALEVEELTVGVVG